MKNLLKRKILISLISFSVIIALAAVMIYVYTMALGKQSLHQLAQEGGFCKQADCADGVDYASTFLSNEFGLSKRGVQWCIGVDEISRRDFLLGETVKNLFTEILYIPCNGDDTGNGSALPMDEE
ncbi:hypothetical protein [Pseudochrobactrum sp. HB0163]|uniref:hypothetical protein n=1 Tax=Pseudochrobactrum sp. HB0163 TaxID=3450708 RepID=UPI003F6DD1E9